MSHKFDINLQMTEMHAAPDYKWPVLLQFHIITITKHPFVLNLPPTYRHIPENLFLRRFSVELEISDFFAFRRLSTKYFPIADNAK